eukprot:4679374-Pleurochrysis_carterae.AAC.1
MEHAAAGRRYHLLHDSGDVRDERAALRSARRHDGAHQKLRDRALCRHGLLLLRLDHAQGAAGLRSDGGTGPGDADGRRPEGGVRKVQVGPLLWRPTSVSPKTFETEDQFLIVMWNKKFGITFKT